MKRFFAGIIAAVLAFSLTIAAFAAEMTVEKNGSKGIDAQAKAVYTNPNKFYNAPIFNGKATITTNKNVAISISADSTALDGLELNVIEIVEDDMEAYSWIDGIMNGLCNRFTAYDIFFNDNNENRVNVTVEVSVSITTPDGYTDVQVYHIGSSARPEKVLSKHSDGNTVFTATGFSYYVLADKIKDDSTTTDKTESDQTESPKTGDTRNMTPWLVFLLISGGTLTLLWVSQKRKRADR